MNRLGHGARAGLVIAAVISGLPGTAAAAVRYAAPGGAGPEATCPASNPCDLSKAVEGPSVANGDEVVVLPGRHQLPGDDPTDSESGINPLTIRKAINVHGTAGAPPTIVAGPDGGAVYLDNPDAVLSDVIVEGTGLGLAAGLAERVLVMTPKNFACYFDKYRTLAQPAPVLRDSVCFGEPDNQTISTGVGASVSPVQPPRALAGKLVNVTAIGTQGISIGALGGSTATVEGTNVIAIGSARGVDVGAYTESGVDTAPDGAGATVSLTNSNYETTEVTGPGASVTPPGTGTNQTAEPVLASPSTGDARQVTGSPTIDAGATVPLLGSFDFEGQPRVQGPAPDIGGDEGSVAAPFMLSAAAQRAIRDLEIDLRCQIPVCGLGISGTVRVRGGHAKRARSSPRAAHSFDLVPRSLTLVSGERKTVKLKLDGGSRRKVEALLEDGAKAQALVEVDTGESGYADREKVKIKPGG
ncbi:MAG: hypothetical protein QOI10_2056 [Solirubrobacterales bacterium]|jgi:hypothetical protein|nr:hypothetical protein [Solirubrobacterales bacterium]